jgi:hypothetical protein
MHRDPEGRADPAADGSQKQDFFAALKRFN